MGRQFVAASSQRLESSSVPVAAVPLTLALWVMPRTFTSTGGLFGIHNNGSPLDHFRVLNNSSGTASAQAASSGSFGTANSSRSMTLSAWNHVAGVFTSSTSRACFVNGAGKGTNATNITPGALTHVITGAHRGSSPDTYSVYHNGIIASPAIWSVALTDAEIRQLAQGADPRTIRPQNLVAFWPLDTPGSTVEFDQNPFAPRRYDLTVTGATPAIDPPIWTPKRKRFFIPSLSVTGNRRRRVICGSAS